MLYFKECLPSMPSCQEFTSASIYHSSEFTQWRRITVLLPQKTWWVFFFLSSSSFYFIFFCVCVCRQFIYIYITITKLKSHVDHIQATGWVAGVQGLTQPQVFNIKCLPHITGVKCCWSHQKLLFRIVFNVYCDSSNKVQIFSEIVLLVCKWVTGGKVYLDC